MSGDGLPQGWTTTQISDILAPQSNGRILHQGWSPQCDSEPAGPGEWGALKTTSIQPLSFHPDQNKRLPSSLKPRPHLAVAVGDILITCAGPRARCGIACLVRMEAPLRFISGKMYRFRPRTSLVDPRYLEAYLQAPSTQHLIDRMKTGISDSGLNLTHERFLRLPVPLAPLPEQGRIVEAIESNFARLDGAVVALEKARAKLDRLRSSILWAACWGSLDLSEDLRGQSSSNNLKPRGSDWIPPPLPVGWHWKRVREVGGVQLGRQRAPKYHVGPHMRPYLRVANVFEDRIDLSEVKQMEFDDSDFEKYKLEVDDILLNEGQTAELVGRPAMVREPLPGFCFQNTLIRFRAGPEVLPLWALTVFRAYVRRGRFKLIAQITTNIAHLGAERFSEIEFPVPPMSEQKRLTDDVERWLFAVNETETGVNTMLGRATMLRKAILSAAFQGRLTQLDSCGGGRSIPEPTSQTKGAYPEPSIHPSAKTLARRRR